MDTATAADERRSAIPIQDHFSGDQLTLARAAGDGDVATVHRLVGTGGVDPDVVSPQGMPLLLWPIHMGNEAGLRALLDSGASPDVADVHGNTPLIWAARTGQAAMVDALLAAGADPDARSARDEPALLVAATGNHWDIVEVLLERGADIDAHQAAGWQTTLNHVASLGQFERALAAREGRRPHPAHRRRPGARPRRRPADPGGHLPLPDRRPSPSRRCAMAAALPGPGARAWHQPTARWRPVETGPRALNGHARHTTRGRVDGAPGRSTSAAWPLPARRMDHDRRRAIGGELRRAGEDGGRVGESPLP